jgi:hypothetical protein
MFKPRQPVLVPVRAYVSGTGVSSYLHENDEYDSLEDAYMIPFGIATDGKFIYNFVDIVQPYGVFSTSYNHYLTILFVFPV